MGPPRGGSSRRIGLRRGVVRVCQPVESPVIKSSRRLISAASVVCTLGAAALVAPIVSDAQANVPNPTSVVNLDPCDSSALSQPFAPWWDFAGYKLAPGGAFEGPGWTLSGGAEFVGGSEPYAATGTLGSSSLSLPAGSSATSSPTCVDAAYPTIRFFIAGTGSVSVNVVYGRIVIPAGVAVAGGEWSPTPVMLTSSAVLGALGGGTAQVSLTFTSLSGNPRIDDVFIDPWRRG